MDRCYCIITSMIACIRTGRQWIEIEKTSDIFNDSLQRLFGFMPSKTSPEKTSTFVDSVRFEETVTKSDTDANLLLKISSQPSSGFTQTMEETAKENIAETEETNEDTSRISGHHAVVDTDNGEQILAHRGQHVEEATSADYD